MRTWTTDALPAADHFSYWREVICEAFTSLNPVANARHAFASSVSQREVGDILISDAASKAQTIVRGTREISRNPTPRFFINLQLSGTCLIRQDTRAVLMRPGDFYLVDTTRPYQQDYSDWQVACVSIPRHLLAPLLVAPENSTAVRLSSTDGGVGMIAGAFIQSLLKCSDTLGTADQALLAASLVNVLAVALGGTVDAQEQGRSTLSHGLACGIRAHIKQHASDPTLSVSGVAAKFGISPRYLHKLFEHSNRSFAQVVLEERLQACAAALSGRGKAHSIADIAYRAGFGDLSYFCRAFRKRFGMSASAFRAEASDRAKARE